MCPRSKVQFAEIRSQSEEKIINAALELFANQGFKTTSISQIAKAAGISKGLIYNYFESKQDLLRRIISDAVEAGKALFQHAVDDFEDPEEELKHLVLDGLLYIKEHYDLMKLLAQISFQKEVLASISDLAEESQQFSIEKGMEVFTKLGAENPMNSTMLLAAMMDGVMLHFLHMKEAYPIDQMGQQIIKMFLNKNSIHRSNS